MRKLKIIFSLSLITILFTNILIVPVLGIPKRTNFENQIQDIYTNKPTLNSKMELYKSMGITDSELSTLSKYPLDLSHKIFEDFIYYSQDGTIFFDRNLFLKSNNNRRTIGSHSEINIPISELKSYASIIQKLIHDYNSDLRLLNTNKKVTTSLKSITLTENIKLSLLNTARGVYTPNCSPVIYVTRTWYEYKLNYDGCATYYLLNTLNTSSMLLLGGSLVCTILGGGSCTFIFAGLSAAISFSKFHIENINNACGRTGVLFKGNAWNGYYPWAYKKC